MSRKKKEKVVEPVAEQVIETVAEPVEEVKEEKPKKTRKPRQPKQEKPVEEFKIELQAEPIHYPEPMPVKVNKFTIGDSVRCKVTMGVHLTVHSIKLKREDFNYPIVYKCYDDCGNMFMICEDMLVAD